MEVSVPTWKHYTRTEMKITTYHCFCFYSRVAYGFVELPISYCCVRRKNVLVLAISWHCDR